MPQKTKIMEKQQEQIREQQKESWNNFSSGWKKWDELAMAFMKPYGDEIITLLKPRDNDVILDVAAGTGQPGLTIASMLKKGKVISTDLSEKMLEVARENAAQKNIRNFETKVCDVSQLTFADNTFDAISCRFGFMFFPDMDLAAREMWRVLKPGGRIAITVWAAAEKNIWVTVLGHAININLELPPPPRGAPGMFRCGEKGYMQDLFKLAGFKNTSEKEVQTKFRCGTPEVYWNMMTEVAAPFAVALLAAGTTMKTKIKNDVITLLHHKFTGSEVALDSSAFVVYGEK
jgi:ubiquinone/menaquinone biosynthesis C-methylase UbiE